MMDLDVGIPLRERILGISSQFSHASIDLDNENIYSDDRPQVNVHFNKNLNSTQENRDLKSGSMASSFLDVNKECANSDDSDSLPAYPELMSSHSNDKLSEFLKTHPNLDSLPQLEGIKEKCSSKKTLVKKVQKEVSLTLFLY